MTMRHGRSLAFVLLTLTLSACGFHLRGQWALPDFLQPLALSLPAGNPPLEQELRDGLQQLGTSPAAGGYRLVIQPEAVERQTAIVDNRAKASEYQLTYLLRWSLTREADKSTALDERVIRIRRSYQYDTTAVVGKATEETTLISEMRREAVQTLLRQLTLLRPAQLLPAPSSGS